MRRRAGAADRAQEQRIDAFDHQRPIDHGQHQKRDGGVECDHQERLVIHGENIAEQHVQQIDIGALDGDDRDTEGERGQIEGRERGVLFQSRGAGYDTGKDCHRKARDQSARRHREQIEPGQ